MSNLPENSFFSGEFSVLMSVYSRADSKFLDEALDSVWTQQSLKPKQICVVCDGPLNNELEEVLRKWSEQLPEVFTRVNLTKHSGLATALNYGLSRCRYSIIARMDADDVSLQDRFEIQYNYLIDHPDIDVLGGQVEECDDDLKSTFSTRNVPLRHEEMLQFAKLRSPLNHPAVMFRKKSIEEAGSEMESRAMIKDR